jgi:transcriptional regulator with XRE-family HTH domain
VALVDQSEPRDESTRAERLGRMIKLYRTAWDMSRKDLAEQAGLSYSYLSEIENGTKYPSSKALHLIAAALDRSPGDLLKAAERSPELPEREPPPEVRAEEDEYRGGFADDLEPAAAKPTPREQRLGARARQRAWFHSELPSLTRAKPGQDRAVLSKQLHELERLLAEMEPDDREIVLDLARRLAAA